MASQQHFNAGETHAQSQMKTEQTMNSAKDSTNAAADKTASAAQSAKESAQDSNSGFLQQTGEQVMNMAQGAMDSVKSAINKE
ncbi:hypothetical protein MRB53_002784 [Persea americana]|uniref:Uncharacterized protein n=1 Tax=Persea americana TaxID=3435 RepID=A0ACC2MWI6_PERAE|nr:hypothetical protein MRB53_002784 [Persea americana]